jgi:hypothetical protein
LKVARRITKCLIVFLPYPKAHKVLSAAILYTLVQPARTPMVLRRKAPAWVHMPSKLGRCQGSENALSLINLILVYL